MTKEELLTKFKVLSRKSDVFLGLKELESTFREYERLLTHCPEQYSRPLSDIFMKISGIRSSIKMASDYQRKKKPVKTKEKISEASRWLTDDLKKVIQILEIDDL